MRILAPLASLALALSLTTLTGQSGDIGTVVAVRPVLSDTEFEDGIVTSTITSDKPVEPGDLPHEARYLVLTQSKCLKFDEADISVSSYSPCWVPRVYETLAGAVDSLNGCIEWGVGESYDCEGRGPDQVVILDLRTAKPPSGVVKRTTTTVRPERIERHESTTTKWALEKP